MERDVNELCTKLQQDLKNNAVTFKEDRRLIVEKEDVRRRGERVERGRGSEGREVYSTKL